MNEYKSNRKDCGIDCLKCHWRSCLQLWTFLIQKAAPWLSKRTSWLTLEHLKTRTSLSEIVPTKRSGSIIQYRNVLLHENFKSSYYKILSCGSTCIPKRLAKFSPGILDMSESPAYKGGLDWEFGCAKSYVFWCGQDSCCWFCGCDVLDWSGDSSMFLRLLVLDNFSQSEKDCWSLYLLVWVVGLMATWHLIALAFLWILVGRYCSCGTADERQYQADIKELDSNRNVPALFKRTYKEWVEETRCVNESLKSSEADSKWIYYL